MKLSRAIKIIALVILGVMVVYWLFFFEGGSVQALFGGKPNGSNITIVMLITIALGVLSWKRPLPGGIIMVVIGFLEAMYYLLYLDTYQHAMPFLLLMCAPLAFCGWLLIEADWRSKKIVARGPNARIP